MNDIHATMAETAYRARIAGDIAGFCAILHPDVVMEQPWSLPVGGTYRGIDAVRAGLERERTGWTSLQYDLERITVGPGILIAYLHVLIESAKGILYAGPVAELLRYRGDKVAELRPFHFDTHRISEIF